jgi:hypothetical protein
MSTLFVSSAMFTACGFNGTYRYPCQDPKNWENTECKPPTCVPSGECSESLVWGEPDGP